MRKLCDRLSQRVRQGAQHRSLMKLQLHRCSRTWRQLDAFKETDVLLNNARTWTR